ncbi:MAG: DUF308 domain-containing protein [Alphaproteobacteria bacterium]
MTDAKRGARAARTDAGIPPSDQDQPDWADLAEHVRKAKTSGPTAPLRVSFGWLGILLVALGLLALVFPFLATFAVTTFVGGAFLAAGLLTFASAFITHPLANAVIKGAWGAAYVIGGALMLYAPLAGAWSLTIVLSGMLLLGGVASTAWALTDPKPAGWGWMTASGAISVGLGVLAAYWLPSAAFWFPGLLAGADLVSTGVAFIALHVAARKFANDA